MSGDDAELRKGTAELLSFSMGVDSQCIGANHITMLSASMDNADKNRSNEKQESVLVREVSDVCTDRSSCDTSRVVLQAESIAMENTNRNTACFIC